MILRLALLSATLFACLLGAEVLTPEKALEIRFSTLGVTCPDGVCDFLQMLPVGHGSFGVTGAAAWIYDGPRLLGVYSNPFCCVVGFRAPSSLASSFYPTIDFTTLEDGTIDGILYLKIGSGFLNWPAQAEAEVQLFHALDLGFFVGNGPLQLTSVRIVDSLPENAVPEASTSTSVVLAAALLAARLAGGRARALAKK